jgi:hypothetical protein
MIKFNFVITNMFIADLAMVIITPCHFKHDFSGDITSDASGGFSLSKGFLYKINRTDMTKNCAIAFFDNFRWFPFWCII